VKKGDDADVTGSPLGTLPAAIHAAVKQLGYRTAKGAVSSSAMRQKRVTARL